MDSSKVLFLSLKGQFKVENWIKSTNFQQSFNEIIVWNYLLILFYIVNHWYQRQ